jgi:glycosyltransferase involved in cell wall biosynthesis
MRICQVLGGNEDGGLEKHTIELSKDLSSKGIDVTVIAHNRFKDDFHGVKFIPVDLAKSRNNIFILYKLYKILMNENFDIIHTQANKATAMIAKLKPFISAKIVSTLHSYKKNLKPFYKSDYVIIVSNKIGEKLYIDNKITIYNGLHPEKIRSIDLHKRFNIPTEDFIICSVGRLSTVKRFDILISSLQYLSHVHLILVGEGKEESILRALADKLGVKDKVTFTGLLENVEAKEIMKSSNLFVITSDKEGFPYVFVESLILETPLISTDVSDIKMLITDKYITPFGDNKELANKIASIQIKYKETIRDFSKIFNHAQNEFTLSTMTHKTIEVYQKVLS